MHQSPAVSYLVDEGERLADEVRAEYAKSRPSTASPLAGSREAVHKQSCAAGCVSHAPACPKREGGGSVVSEVRTRAGRPVLNVPTALLTALRQHVAVQEHECRAAGTW